MTQPRSNMNHMMLQNLRPRKQSLLQISESHSHHSRAPSSALEALNTLKLKQPRLLIAPAITRNLRLAPASGTVYGKFKARAVTERLLKPSASERKLKVVRLSSTGDRRT